MFKPVTNSTEKGKLAALKLEDYFRPNSWRFRTIYLRGKVLTGETRGPFSTSNVIEV
jgi:hypothetical protein